MKVRTLILVLLLAIAALTPVLFFYQEDGSLGVVGAVAGFLFFYPTLRANSSWFGPVVTRFDTSRREVWLTIDDGPDPQDTPQILALLARYQARATFFLVGERAARHPDLVREILRQGHTIGNHTDTHPVASFWMALPGRIAREVDACATRLSSVARAPLSPFFRAPVGMANFFVLPVLRRRKLILVGWSARGFDAVRTDPPSIVQRIWSAVRPGAIILLHEGNHPAGKEPVNPRCLELLLERLAAAGYACVLPGLDQLQIG